MEYEIHISRQNTKRKREINIIFFSSYVTLMSFLSLFTSLIMKYTKCVYSRSLIASIIPSTNHTPKSA